MAKPSVKSIAISLLVLASLAVNGVILHYNWWRDSFNAELDKQSQVIKTVKGAVEYLSLGNVATEKNHLMILHGTAGGHDAGEILADWLALDEDTHVIVPSRPGYLRTPIHSGLTPRQSADAMAALLDELKIDKITVLGWGGGALTAMAMAQYHPQKLDGLVLLSPMVKHDEKFNFANQNSARVFNPAAVYVERDFFGRDFKAYLQWQGHQWAPDFIFKGLLPDKLANIELTLTRLKQIASTLLPPSRRELGRQNDYFNFARLSATPQLDIRLPTLVIHSVDDEIVDFAQGRYAAEHIEGAELFEVKDESHFSTINALAVGKFHAFLEQLRK